MLNSKLSSAGHGEVKVRRHPQHVTLATAFQVLAQPGAGAIHLIPAHEVQPDAISEDLGEQVDGQLPLGAEHQIIWQAHDLLLGWVIDMLARNPLPGGDQRVPGLLPHIRHVDRGDPVGHLPRAAQVVPLDPGGMPALLDLPGLIDRANH